MAHAELQDAGNAAISCSMTCSPCFHDRYCLGAAKESELCKRRSRSNSAPVESGARMLRLRMKWQTERNRMHHILTLSQRANIVLEPANASKGTLWYVCMRIARSVQHAPQSMLANLSDQYSPQSRPRQHLRPRWLLPSQAPSHRPRSQPHCCPPLHCSLGLPLMILAPLLQQPAPGSDTEVQAMTVVREFWPGSSCKKRLGLHRRADGVRPSDLLPTQLLETARHTAVMLKVWQAADNMPGHVNAIDPTSITDGGVHGLLYQTL